MIGKYFIVKTAKALLGNKKNPKYLISNSNTIAKQDYYYLSQYSIVGSDEIFKKAPKNKKRWKHLENYIIIQKELEEKVN